MCLCQAYIALVRLFNEKPNYKKWFCFDYADYIDRQCLAVTFNNRHLPLSTGEIFPQFGGLVLDPPVWHEKVGPKPKRNRKSKKASSAVITSTVQDEGDDSNDDDDEELTIFEPTTGKFFPVYFFSFFT